MARPDWEAEAKAAGRKLYRPKAKTKATKATKAKATKDTAKE